MDFTLEFVSNLLKENHKVNICSKTVYVCAKRDRLEIDYSKKKK